ncbi:MAG TPA: hypothetical protein VL913_00745 [Candidatus Micrarchaeaceae archaeon]|nr:hypothetical protein [Candidatus Micrarchaeaceae archaeon]
MNKSLKLAAVILLALAALSLAAAAGAQDKRNSAGEEFFIVSSVDLKNSALLLKRPTEVTVQMKIQATTKLVDAQGKAMKLSDFRAGDTIWAVAKTDASGALLATSVRIGPMTVPELHALYLDYPVINN